MKFPHATFDIGLGEPTIIFQATSKHRLMLTGMLNVYIGNGGGVIQLATDKEASDNGKPTGLLVDCATHRAVGIIATDFEESGLFGILESEGGRLHIAEEFGRQVDRLTYKNSMTVLE